MINENRQTSRTCDVCYTPINPEAGDVPSLCALCRTALTLAGGSKDRKRTIRAVLAWVDGRGLSELDLDDVVHDIKDREACDINNCGMTEQVKYIVRAFGDVEEVIRVILGLGIRLPISPRRSRH